MKYNAIVYARYNSSRLPGKVLLKVGEKEILGICVEKLSNINDLNVIVATSDQPTDDPIVEWCLDKGINFFRGDLNDVAQRTRKCLQHYVCEAFFRINADSPFLQMDLIKQAIHFYNENRYDIVTNIQERSYPYGIAVELIRSSLFIDESLNFSAAEKEHITSFFYKNSDKFRIKNIKSDIDFSQYRFVLDTPEDLKVLTELYKKDNNILNYDLLNLIKIKN